jgi:phage-related baseplate assembly protein
MTTLNIEKLATMKEQELNKLTKAELIAAIQKDCWMVSSNKREVSELKETISRNSTNERAACVMLAAMVGKDLSVDEYSGQVNSRNLNILELVGLVAKRLADIGR